ncbi:hypothetical protein [Clostridium sp. HMP27]|uniref:hypothetical protein n=1 Tax=Clostridium sp. HMP27 TaxID=1487921 RepID=UPI00052C87FE|nr:hypothetical protein [Clostridium sp. HMP27]KGK86607.1 hypothetical protein DP68_13455 [Clostridium sp. HMP27]
MKSKEKFFFILSILCLISFILIVSQSIYIHNFGNVVMIGVPLCLIGAIFLSISKTEKYGWISWIFLLLIISSITLLANS